MTKVIEKEEHQICRRSVFKKKNNLWDGEMSLLQKAFQSEVHLDKFIDLMIELWTEPTPSKLIQQTNQYLLQQTANGIPTPHIE